jgi:hypothetical protein
MEASPDPAALPHDEGKLGTVAQTLGETMADDQQSDADRIDRLKWLADPGNDKHDLDPADREAIGWAAERIEQIDRDQDADRAWLVDQLTPIAGAFRSAVALLAPHTPRPGIKEE